MRLTQYLKLAQLKSSLALALSILLMAESLPAAPLAPSASSSIFSVAIPGTLGYITDAYSPRASRDQKPDVILLQNLHVNRSVQFAISKILGHLKKQNLLPSQIAVEGATGPMDIAEMQAYPDAKVRKAAADYLVEQGEMPGAMHFAITEGQTDRQTDRQTELYGVETAEVYQANLEVYRRSYSQRSRLKEELGKLSYALPALRRNPSLKEKADLLAKDVAAISRLINTQTVSNEIPSTLNQVLGSVDRLKQVLPKEVGDNLIETLSAGAHFYAFALMRDEDMFNNTMVLRRQANQKTTVLITGGFHTKGLAEQFKKAGLSYVVITPNVRKHDAVDEKLYVERLLGHHLTPDQVAQGLDWASMDQLEPVYLTPTLFSSAVKSITLPLRRKIAVALIAALAPFAPWMVAQQPPPQLPPAPALRTPQQWANFIHEQRPQTAERQLGLPVTFREAAGDRMPDPDAEMIIREAAQAYDTALAVMELDDAGNHAEADDILIKLLTGSISAMPVHAAPSRDNNGAFAPHRDGVSYLFNMTPANGQNRYPAWKFWSSNTGPSAWVAIAIVHHFEATGVKNPVLLRELRGLGDAMILLQDNRTQGGVRYGAHHQPNQPDYNQDFDRINSENEVSAHAALRRIAVATGDAKYNAAADRIQHWLTQADIYNPETGQMQKGMMDSKTGLLYVDANWNARNNRWEIQPRHATDSGGTWTISSLGADFIDQTWGKQASFRMWQSIRSGMGWTANYQRPGANDQIAGVDFTNTDEGSRAIPSSDALISPEWTGGAVRAVEHLINFYENGAGKGQLSTDQIEGLKKDVSSMRAWLDAHPNPYAFGPGMTSQREGRTYWGWFSGHGTAMAAVYIHIAADPLRPGQSAAIVSAPPARPAPATKQTPAPAPRAAPNQASNTEVRDLPGNHTSFDSGAALADIQHFNQPETWQPGDDLYIEFPVEYAGKEVGFRTLRPGISDADHGIQGNLRSYTIRADGTLIIHQSDFGRGPWGDFEIHSGNYFSSHPRSQKGIRWNRIGFIRAGSRASVEMPNAYKGEPLEAVLQREFPTPLIESLNVWFQNLSMPALPRSVKILGALLAGSSLAGATPLFDQATLPTTTSFLAIGIAAAIAFTVYGLWSKKKGLSAIGIGALGGLLYLALATSFNRPAESPSSITTTPEPSAAVTQTPTAQNSTPAPKGFDMEFNGSANSKPDPKQWTYDLGATGWGNNELETYTNSATNAHLDGNGHLVIHVEKNGSTYTSARLKTQGLISAQYGHLEARIKMPGGQGIWPAWWMLGNQFATQRWPAAGEIDIMENTESRGPNINFGTIHGPGYSGGSGPSKMYTLPDGQRFSDDFHVFAIDWAPGSIKWYVDGNLYHTETRDSLPAGRQWVFDQPFFMMLNVAVGGNFGGNPDSTTQFPKDLVVDYIRYTPLPGGIPQIAAAPQPAPAPAPGSRAQNLQVVAGTVSNWPTSGEGNPLAEILRADQPFTLRPGEEAIVHIKGKYPAGSRVVGRLLSPDVSDSDRANPLRETDYEIQSDGTVRLPESYWGPGPWGFVEIHSGNAFQSRNPTIFPTNVHFGRVEIGPVGSRASLVNPTREPDVEASHRTFGHPGPGLGFLAAAEGTPFDQVVARNVPLMEKLGNRLSDISLPTLPRWAKIVGAGLGLSVAATAAPLIPAFLQVSAEGSGPFQLLMHGPWWVMLPLWVLPISIGGVILLIFAGSKLRDQKIRRLLWLAAGVMSISAVGAISDSERKATAHTEQKAPNGKQSFSLAPFPLSENSTAHIYNGAGGGFWLPDVSKDKMEISIQSSNLSAVDGVTLKIELESRGAVQNKTSSADLWLTRKDGQMSLVEVNNLSTEAVEIREENGHISLQISLAALAVAAPATHASGHWIKNISAAIEYKQNMPMTSITDSVTVQKIVVPAQTAGIEGTGSNSGIMAGTGVILAAVFGVSYLLNHAAQASVVTAGISPSSLHQWAVLAAFAATIAFIEKLRRRQQNIAEVAMLREVVAQMPITDTVGKYVRTVLNYSPDWLRERFMRNPILAARYGHKVDEMGIVAMAVAA